MTNIIEIFNEFTVLLSLYCGSLFLDIRIPIKLQDNLGWFTVGCSVLNIGVNMAIVGYLTVMELLQSLKD